MALHGNVVVRRPGEPEVYAQTADLHERFSPGNPGWGHPPLEDEVRMTDEGWGLVTDPGSTAQTTVPSSGPVAPVLPSSRERLRRRRSAPMPPISARPDTRTSGAPGTPGPFTL
jgi:hypothetical protein